MNASPLLTAPHPMPLRAEKCQHRRQSVLKRGNLPSILRGVWSHNSPPDDLRITSTASVTCNGGTSRIALHVTGTSTANVTGNGGGIAHRVTRSRDLPDQLEPADCLVVTV